MNDERNARRTRLMLPRTLALNVLGLALSACSPAAPHADASPGSDAVMATDASPGTDAVVATDVSPGSDAVTATDVASSGDGAPCSAVMQGRACTTDCVTLGSAPDGFAGLVPDPCEVYCDLDSGECFEPDGSLSPCERSGAPDGGTEIFC